jgi:hypothetical protein
MRIVMKSFFVVCVIILSLPAIRSAQNLPKIIKVPPVHFHLRYVPYKSDTLLLNRGEELVRSILHRDPSLFLPLLPESEPIVLETYENRTATKQEIIEGMQRWQKYKKDSRRTEYFIIINCGL